MTDIEIDKACASGDSFIAEMRKDFGGRIVG